VYSVNSFWLAAYYGHGGIMGILAANGIDVFNQHSKRKSNALHVAVEKNYLNIVMMLIKSNYPLDVPNSDGMSALCIAACNESKIPILKELTESGANVNYTNEEGVSAIYFAIKYDNFKAIKYLLKHGAALYYEEESKRENSPLFFTIRSQNIKVIEYLCDHNADLSVKNLEG
jgi:ankyrin repeat protein